MSIFEHQQFKVLHCQTFKDNPLSHKDQLNLANNWAFNKVSTRNKSISYTIEYKGVISQIDVQNSIIFHLKSHSTFHYKKITDLEIMQTALLQYYLNGDISLMKEFLMSVPIFNEIHYFLDSDKFYRFLQFIEVHPVQYSQPFELKPTSTYLFLSTGILIPKKQKRQNFHRLSRLSRTVKFSHIFVNKDSFNQQQQRQSQKIMTAQTNQLFNQSLLYNSNFIGENLYFINNQQKKSALIELNFNKIPQDILNELRQKHNQKLKFISGLNIFKNVQKYLIEINLSKFHVLKVSFDEFLMKQSLLRSSCLFFITSGEVQILLEEKKSYLTKSPAVIGVQKMKYAKSVTECCLCYYVQRNEVIDILKRNMEGKFKNPQTEEQLNRLTKCIVKEKSLSDLESSMILPTQYGHFEENQPRYERCNTMPVSPLFKIDNDSMLLNSKQNIHKNSEKVPDIKKYRIKEHFTNFLNDRYSQFAIKKTEFLKKKKDNNDSVLYEMKTLQPKQPQMDSINQRLKIQRLNRLQKCKQNIMLTKEESLNSVNLRIYEEFEDSKLINKIRKNIEQNISKKQRGNKHWKSIAQNSISFNRMLDLSIDNSL